MTDFYLRPRDRETPGPTTQGGHGDWASANRMLLENRPLLVILDRPLLAHIFKLEQVVPAK